MKNYEEDYNNASASGGDMPAGGYILKITYAMDVPNKEYLRVEVDIAEGEFKDYYFQLLTRANFWGLTTYKSYKKKNMGWFKQFIQMLEKENDGFVWDWDETKLVGLQFGGILRLEEYMGNDGNVKASLKLFKTCSVADIKSGNFTVPPIKKLAQTTHSAGVVDKSASSESFEELNDNVPF